MIQFAARQNIYLTFTSQLQVGTSVVRTPLCVNDILVYFMGLPCNTEQLPSDRAGGGFWSKLCHWSRTTQLKNALGTKTIHS